MEGYRVKEYGMPVKRYCQALDLKNNPELIAEYRKIHSREKSLAGNSGGNPFSGDIGNGNLYRRLQAVHDCGSTA